MRLDLIRRNLANDNDTNRRANRHGSVIANLAISQRLSRLRDSSRARLPLTRAIDDEVP
jgi:hypothetical protein